MAKEILDTIMSIQPKDSSGGGGETRETVVGRLAADMLSKLPPDYIPHEVRARLKKMGAMSSMNIFLKQEIDRMQRVISLVRNTLQDLQLAIEGTIIMSEVSECIVQCTCIRNMYMYFYAYVMYMYFYAYVMYMYFYAYVMYMYFYASVNVYHPIEFKGCS